MSALQLDAELFVSCDQNLVIHGRQDTNEYKEEEEEEEEEEKNKKMQGQENGEEINLLMKSK